MLELLLSVGLFGAVSVLIIAVSIGTTDSKEI